VGCQRETGNLSCIAKKMSSISELLKFQKEKSKKEKVTQLVFSIFQNPHEI
jgi:hypothetical protein